MQQLLKLLNSEAPPRIWIYVSAVEFVLPLSPSSSFLRWISFGLWNFCSDFWEWTLLQPYWVTESLLAPWIASTRTKLEKIGSSQPPSVTSSPSSFLCAHFLLPPCLGAGKPFPVRRWPAPSWCWLLNEIDTMLAILEQGFALLPQPHHCRKIERTPCLNHRPHHIRAHGISRGTISYPLNEHFATLIQPKTQL